MKYISIAKPNLLLNSAINNAGSSITQTAANESNDGRGEAVVLKAEPKESERVIQDEDADTNPWHVYYYEKDDETSNKSNQDGSVTKWDDGWFVAKVGSKNAQHIINKPSTVIVDGISYHYVSSQYVDMLRSDYSAIKDYMGKNNGIGFQTSYHDDFWNALLVHYEPDSTIA